MFRAVSFRMGTAYDSPLDIGAVTEAMIFYDRVSLVLDEGSLRHLLRHIPPNILLSLIREGHVEVHLQADFTVVHSQPTVLGRDLHHFLTAKVQDRPVERVASSVFQQVAGDTAEARLNARKFAGMVQPFTHEGFDQGGFTNWLGLNGNQSKAIQAILGHVLPDMTFEDVEFGLTTREGGLLVETNLDFERVRSELAKRRVIDAASFTEAHLLSLLQRARETTFVAARCDSEVAVSPLERVLQSADVQILAHQFDRDDLLIGNFQELVFDNARCIREAVNGRAVNFAEVRTTLQRATKFKGWIRGKAPDANLLNEYYKEVVADTWLSKLPVKTARWMMFLLAGKLVDGTVTGGIGTLLGAGVSAIDTFIVDKLAGGWRPSQFVERSLRPTFARDN